MSDQATVDDRAQPDGRSAGARPTSARSAPAETLTRSVSDFRSNLVGLAELQLKLLGEDAKAGVQRLIMPATLLVMAVALTLAATALVLGAAAVGITAATELHLGWSLAICAAVGLVLAAVAVWYALAKVRASCAVFNRSREELAENIRYLKASLRSEVHSEAPTPRSMW